MCFFLGPCLQPSIPTHTPTQSTSSPGSSSCRMTRMSGQSCVREQGTGAKWSGRSSVITGVSFSAGKKVSRSHKCPPSSSSSLTSAATSHKSLGSVRMKIHFPTEHNESIQKNKLNNQVSSLPASLSDLFLPTSDMSGLIPSIPSACCKNI